MKRKIPLFITVLLLIPVSLFGAYKIYTNSCKYYYLGNDKGLVKFFFGDKIVVYPGDAIVCARLIDSCYWEVPEWFVIKPLLSISDNIIEIGSNFGAYTVKMAKLIKKGGGKLYSFEASPFVFKYLSHTIETNGLENVQLNNKAVFNKIGQMHFNQFKEGQNVGGSHLIFDEAHTGGTPVDVVTLDSMFPEQNDISFMKIDAEGSECGIFMSAKNILHNDRLTIVMEWAKEMQERSGVDVKKCTYDLEQVYGFKMYKITGATLKKIDAQYLLNEPGLYDVVLTKHSTFWITFLSAIGHFIK